MTVVSQLIRKFLGQLDVSGRREVAQGIANGQLLNKKPKNQKELRRNNVLELQKNEPVVTYNVPERLYLHPDVSQDKTKGMKRSCIIIIESVASHQLLP